MGAALGLCAGLACEAALPRLALAEETAQGLSREELLADYEARRLFLEENNNDLRLPALQARDRRGSIPNDKRPPARRTPERSLPPNPEATKGVIRRISIPSGEKVCALTFDMCELETSTSGFDTDMIIWLQDNNIPATLFMGGKWMRTHERRVREVLRDPLFEVGNHAWAHGNFGLLTPARMREEVLDTQCQYELLRARALKDAARSTVGGTLPIPEVLRFFRFPYGRCTPQALALLAEYGLEPVQWDVVAETGGNNASLARSRHVVSQVKPGSILLFHANMVPKGSFQLLRYVATALQRQGYRFATVGELLAMGTPERELEGYFEKPGDNADLDRRFGSEGTGRR